MIASQPPEALLEALSKRLGLVLSKRSGLALAVWGEAGIGKSRLAKQVLQAVPCRSAGVRAGDGLGVLLAQLPQSPQLPLWVEQSLPKLASGEISGSQAADALVAYLNELKPFVLLVEDLHEARPDQQAFWLELVQEAVRVRGVGLLFTSRTPPPPPLEPYAMGPMDFGQTQNLLEQVASGSLPREAVEWIFDRSQGNPLFSLEYFRHLSRLGYVWSDGQRWRWRGPETELMPSSIEALIHQLTQNYPNPTAQAALQARSILGETAPSALWAAVAELPLDLLKETQAQLEQQGLLMGGAFVHPLFAEVIRRELPPLTRQTLSRRAVAQLQAVNPVEAAGFVVEADLPAAEATALLQQAAEQASSERQRARFLAQASQLGFPPNQGQLALQAAQILRDFDLLEALKTLEQAQLGGPLPVAAVYLKAELLSALGRGEEAERLLLGLGQSDQGWQEAVLEAKASQANPAAALDWWEAHPQMQAAASVATQVHVGRSLANLGHYSQAQAFLQQAAAKAAPLDAAWLQQIYAYTLLEQGDFAQAVTVLDGAIQVYENIKPSQLEHKLAQSRRAAARRTRSVAQYRWGRYREAISDLEGYLHFVSQQGDGRRFAEGQANLGLYLLEFGLYERAEEVLQESRTVLEQTANHRGLSIVGQGLVRLYLEWAPPHGGALALKHAQVAEFHARKAASPPTLAETLAFVAWAEAVHGQGGRALALVEELQTLAEGLSEHRLKVFALWVQGLALERLGRAGEAQERLSEAVGQMRELGHAPFAHRMALELDRLADNRKAAHTRIAHFERAGNQNWANIARRYFPQAPALPETSEGVRLEVLGSLEIYVQGQRIKYEARKGRELLAMLLENRIAGRSELNQLELYDTLYPEMDEDKAASALKQLVYRLRTALGNSAINRTSSGYALGGLSSDAEEFLRTGQTQLWRGPYLQGLGSFEASVSDSLYHALRTKAETLIAEEAEEALRLSKLMLEADPYDTQALRLGLQALHQGHNNAALERMYAQYQARFAEVGELLPEDWQQL